VRPREFLAHARRNLARYQNISWKPLEIHSAQRKPDGSFTVTSDTGHHERCRKLLICTGLFDTLPGIAGIGSFFGKTVFQCPYCDGWEFHGKRLIAYGKGARGYEMARALTAWSRDLTLCSDGASQLSGAQRTPLRRNKVGLIETTVERACGKAGRIEHLLMTDGSRVPCDALFFDTPARPQSNLAQMLGCEPSEKNGVRCSKYLETSVPGVYVAGNITRDVQLAIVAAAEGAKAAFAINRALTREDFGPP
jgi:thioredoxin reductase